MMWPILDKLRIEYEYDVAQTVMPVVIGDEVELVNPGECRVSLRLDGKDYSFHVMEAGFDGEPEIWTTEKTDHVRFDLSQN